MIKKIISQNLILSLLLLLGGCSNTNKIITTGITKTPNIAESYSQQVKPSNVISKQNYNYQLLAVNQALAENYFYDSQQLLNYLNQISSNTNIDSQKEIAQAKIDLSQNHPKSALKKLHQIKNPMGLPRETAIAYYVIAAEAHLRNNDLAYNAIALISLDSLLNNQELQQKNENIIWRNLQTLSLNDLQVLLQRCNTKLLRGWVRLAIIAHQNANNPAALLKSIKSWQQQYPQHPANNVVPDENTLGILAQTNVPDQIALLLPLHGKFAKMGQAVRDGFMTAYYANLKMLSKSPKIKIYDTSENDVINLYQQAVNDGARFVVGPLTKENVAKLASYNNLKVTDLALNYLTNR